MNSLVTSLVYGVSRAPFWAIRGSVPPLAYMKIAEGKQSHSEVNGHDWSVPSAVPVVVLYRCWDILRLRDFSDSKAATRTLDQ